MFLLIRATTMDNEAATSSTLRLPDEDNFENTVLIPCSICGRTFKSESLLKHQGVCQKNATKKRRVFDSMKQRLQGTELAEYIPIPVVPSKPKLIPINKAAANKLVKESNRQGESPNVGQNASTPVSTEKGQKAAIVRSNSIGSHGAARGARAAFKEERCPHCDRTFGWKAFSRHEEWCREHKTRLAQAQSPAAVLKAKEMLDARIKYRAPLLGKIKRPTNREKYAAGAHCSPAMVHSISKLAPEDSPVISSLTPKVAVSSSSRESRSRAKSKSSIVHSPAPTHQSTTPSSHVGRSAASRKAMSPSKKATHVPQRPREPSTGNEQDIADVENMVPRSSGRNRNNPSSESGGDSGRREDYDKVFVDSRTSFEYLKQNDKDEELIHWIKSVKAMLRKRNLMQSRDETRKKEKMVDGILKCYEIKEECPASPSEERFCHWDQESTDYAERMKRTFVYKVLGSSDDSIDNNVEDGLKETSESPRSERINVDFAIGSQNCKNNEDLRVMAGFSSTNTQTVKGPVKLITPSDSFGDQIIVNHSEEEQAIGSPPLTKISNTAVSSDHEVGCVPSSDDSHSEVSKKEAVQSNSRHIKEGCSGGKKMKTRKKSKLPVPVAKFYSHSKSAAAAVEKENGSQLMVNNGNGTPVKALSINESKFTGGLNSTFILPKKSFEGRGLDGVSCFDEPNVKGIEMDSLESSSDTSPLIKRGIIRKYRPDAFEELPVEECRALGKHSKKLTQTLDSGMHNLEENCSVPDHLLIKNNDSLHKIFFGVESYRDSLRDIEGCQANRFDEAISVPSELERRTWPKEDLKNIGDHLSHGTEGNSLCGYSESIEGKDNVVGPSHQHLSIFDNHHDTPLAVEDLDTNCTTGSGNHCESWKVECLPSKSYLISKKTVNDQRSLICSHRACEEKECIEETVGLLGERKAVKHKCYDVPSCEGAQNSEANSQNSDHCKTSPKESHKNVLNKEVALTGQEILEVSCEEDRILCTASKALNDVQEESIRKSIGEKQMCGCSCNKHHSDLHKTTKESEIAADFVLNGKEMDEKCMSKHCFESSQLYARSEFDDIASRSISGNHCHLTGTHVIPHQRNGKASDQTSEVSVGLDNHKDIIDEGSATAVLLNNGHEMNMQFRQKVNKNIQPVAEENNEGGSILLSSPKEPIILEGKMRNKGKTESKSTSSSASTPDNGSNRKLNDEVINNKGSHRDFDVSQYKRDGNGDEQSLENVLLKSSPSLSLYSEPASLHSDKNSTHKLSHIPSTLRVCTRSPCHLSQTPSHLKVHTQKQSDIPPNEHSFCHLQQFERKIGKSSKGITEESIGTVSSGDEATERESVKHSNRRQPLPFNDVNPTAKGVLGHVDTFTQDNSGRNVEDAVSVDDASNGHLPTIKLESDDGGVVASQLKWLSLIRTLGESDADCVESLERVTVTSPKDNLCLHRKGKAKAMKKVSLTAQSSQALELPSESSVKDKLLLNGDTEEKSICVGLTRSDLRAAEDRVKSRLLGYNRQDHHQLSAYSLTCSELVSHSPMKTLPRRNVKCSVGHQPLPSSPQPIEKCNSSPPSKYAMHHHKSVEEKDVGGIEMAPSSKPSSTRHSSYDPFSKAEMQLKELLSDGSEMTKSMMAVVPTTKQTFDSQYSEHTLENGVHEKADNAVAMKNGNASVHEMYTSQKQAKEVELPDFFTETSTHLNFEMPNVVRGRDGFVNTKRRAVKPTAQNMGIELNLIGRDSSVGRGNVNTSRNVCSQVEDEEVEHITSVMNMGFCIPEISGKGNSKLNQRNELDIDSIHQSINLVALGLTNLSTSSQEHLVDLDNNNTLQDRGLVVKRAQVGGVLEQPRPGCKERTMGGSSGDSEGEGIGKRTRKRSRRRVGKGGIDGAEPPPCEGQAPSPESLVAVGTIMPIIGGKPSVDSAYSSLNRPTFRTIEQAKEATSKVFDPLHHSMSSDGENDHADEWSDDEESKKRSQRWNIETPTTDPSVAFKFARFCHNCGSKYPLTEAKFCCVCGSQRLAV